MDTIDAIDANNWERLPDCLNLSSDSPAQSPDLKSLLSTNDSALTTFVRATAATWLRDADLKRYGALKQLFFSLGKLHPALYEVTQAYIRALDREWVLKHLDSAPRFETRESL